MKPTARELGPSPRARGSPRERPTRCTNQGSIPACAGQSGASSAPLSVGRVHPRVRGAVRNALRPLRPRAGPSPRARGSLSRWHSQEPFAGSIPACAGQSRPVGRRRFARWVHPRVRGAVVGKQCRSLRDQGPSPRARGSPHSAPGVRIITGSIPACAGQSTHRSAPYHQPWVHPRVRGAVRAAPTGGVFLSGPSPRARGSRALLGEKGGFPGSIPACAGQSLAGRLGPSVCRVHPRVRGAVAVSEAERPRPRGPSPRARGSRVVKLPVVVLAGSIPACAGQSPRRLIRSSVSRVHPRVRGAVDCARASGRRQVGPSPRARGSRVYSEFGSHLMGSIPACAGQSRSTTQTKRN